MVQKVGSGRISWFKWRPWREDSPQDRPLSPSLSLSLSLSLLILLLLFFITLQPRVE